MNGGGSDSVPGMTFALFGIENDGVNLAVNLLVFFLVVIWLALVYWTYSDAQRRIDDPMLVGCATAASLFPFIGTIVYTIVRPPEYLEDARERELEIKAAEARVRMLERPNLPQLRHADRASFLRCPSCLRKLKDPCASCGKPLDPRWRSARTARPRSCAGSAQPPRRSAAGEAGRSEPRRRRRGASDRQRASPARAASARRRAPQRARPRARPRPRPAQLAAAPTDSER